MSRFRDEARKAGIRIGSNVGSFSTDTAVALLTESRRPFRPAYMARVLAYIAYHRKLGEDPPAVVKQMLLDELDSLHFADVTTPPALLA